MWKIWWGHVINGRVLIDLIFSNCDFKRPYKSTELKQKNNQTADFPVPLNTSVEENRSPYKFECANNTNMTAIDRSRVKLGKKRVDGFIEK